MRISQYNKMFNNNKIKNNKRNNNRLNRMLIKVE
jgi:hypothetical protein